MRSTIPSSSTSVKKAAEKGEPAVCFRTKAQSICSRSDRAISSTDAMSGSCSLIAISFVGAWLARSELRTAFTVLLERLDDFELARPLDDVAHQFSFFLRPLKELPIRFRVR